MENLNPDKKSLQQIIDEAESKQFKIVIIESPIVDGHHRIAAFIASDNFMVIKMDNLNEEDQNRIRSLPQEKETENSPFKNPPIPIKSMEQFRDDVVLDEKKFQHHPFHTHMKPSPINKRAFVPKFKAQRGRR